ncbi:MAG: glycosyltransferase [Lactobacillales bacterium]|jgi:cellulose synthase (UDP-forming)|nr:glycosyltransferase [Lactobacillales bacterium]
MNKKDFKTKLWQGLRPILFPLNILVSTLYILWRIVHLPLDSIAIIASLLLLIVEIVSIFEVNIQLLASNLMQKHTVNYEVIDERLIHDYPTVDVLIPTYSESREILAETIAHAKRLNYPQNAYQITLCDDGEREEIKELCQNFGVGYIPHQNDGGAKASNLNHALAQINGEYVTVLDADNLVHEDFLKQTLSAIRKLDREGFVQASEQLHDGMIDQFQKGLKISDDSQLAFNEFIQPSRNGFQGATCCGHLVLFNRKALDEVGGFDTTTITEDFMTGMRMHERGYQSVALHYVGGKVLPARNFNGLIKQYQRWSTGNIQGGVRALMKMKLNALQKSTYYRMVTTWLSGVKQPILLAVSAFMVLTQLPIMKVNIYEFLIVFGIYYSLHKLSNYWILGFRRTPSVDSMINFVTFPYLVKTNLSAIFQNKQRKFYVTSKKQEGVRTQRETFRLALPFYVLMIFEISLLIHGWLTLSFFMFDFSVIWMYAWVMANLIKSIKGILFIIETD